MLLFLHIERFSVSGMQIFFQTSRGFNINMILITKASGKARRVTGGRWQVIYRIHINIFLASTFSFLFVINATIRTHWDIQCVPCARPPWLSHKFNPQEIDLLQKKSWPPGRPKGLESESVAATGSAGHNKPLASRWPAICYLLENFLRVQVVTEPGGQN